MTYWFKRRFKSRSFKGGITDIEIIPSDVLSDVGRKGFDVLNRGKWENFFSKSRQKFLYTHCYFLAGLTFNCWSLGHS